MATKQVEGLRIERTADEILALKPGTGGAHALNQTATIVFDLCDGEHSKSEMATAIQHHTGLPADERVVDLALDGLIEAGLVVLDGSPPEARTTRRALIRLLSLSAAAVALLPVVETIPLTPAATADPPLQTARLQKPPGVGIPPPRRQPGPPPGSGQPPGRGGPPPGAGS